MGKEEALSMHPTRKHSVDPSGSTQDIYFIVQELVKFIKYLNYLDAKHLTEEHS